MVVVGGVSQALDSVIWIQMASRLIMKSGCVLKVDLVSKLLSSSFINSCHLFINSLHN